MQVPDKLKSRKLWITIVTAILIAFNDALGVGLDEETITQLVAVVGAYVLGQSAVDFTIAKAEAQKYNSWINATVKDAENKRDSG